MTPADVADIARLRKLQRRANASLNVIATRISDTGDIRPSAEQWMVLWSALEAATVMLQGLSDQLAAAQMTARAHRRQIRIDW